MTEARRRYYAEEQQESGSGDGNQQQGSPRSSRDLIPLSRGGSSQMMQGPPRWNGEGAPAPDHLLGVAGQAVAQAIEQQTQRYQQIIAPLSQGYPGDPVSPSRWEQGPPPRRHPAAGHY